MPSYGGAPRMSRLLTAGLGVLSLAAVLVPPGLAQERWGDWDWWDQTTPSAVQERLDHGTDPTVRGQDGLTPLHGAAKHRTPEVVAVLLDHGADATLRDNQNKLPADYAAENTALQGTAVYQRLLAVPSAAPGSLAAWSDVVAQPSSRSATPSPNCYQFTASGQRPTTDDVVACLEAQSCGAYREWDPELEACVRTAEAPVWDTDLLHSSCGAYRE